MSTLDVTMDEAFLAEEVADSLFSRLVHEVSWDERMRARSTASFGAPYDYSGLTYEPSPWPPWLDVVRASIEQRVEHALTNCLANLYRDGHASMGFHADSYARLEPTSSIAILSLGMSRTLRFRDEANRARVIDYSMSHGALFLMRPSVQTSWKHSVPPEDRAGPRVSLTFRWVR